MKKAIKAKVGGKVVDTQTGRVGVITEVRHDYDGESIFARPEGMSYTQEMEIPGVGAAKTLTPTSWKRLASGEYLGIWVDGKLGEWSSVRLAEDVAAVEAKTVGKKITSVGCQGEFDASEREFGSLAEAKKWWVKRLGGRGAVVTFDEELDDDGDGTLTVSRYWPELAPCNRNDRERGYIYIQERA